MVESKKVCINPQGARMISWCSVKRCVFNPQGTDDIMVQSKKVRINPQGADDIMVESKKVHINPQATRMTLWYRVK